MCGRFNFTAEEAAEIQQIIRDVQDKLRGGDTIKTGEIHPTNLVPVRLRDSVEPMRWGFPRSWKSGIDINAKIETALDPQKRYWNRAAANRCVIVSSGFYEWEVHEDKGKTQMLFRDPHSPVVYMAGFYNEFPDKAADAYPRFVIVTTAPNDSVKAIHNRMPLVLLRSEVEPWLNRDIALDEIQDRSQVTLSHVAV